MTSFHGGDDNGSGYILSRRLYASPATVTRAGVLYITDDSQWKNYVQAWINDWAANLTLPRSGEKLRGEFKSKAEELFEKFMCYCTEKIKS